MPTMEQLGNDINKTLSTSTSPIKTGRSTPTYTQPKTALSNLEADLQKLDSGINTVAQSLYKTSEYAHKLVAIDKAKQFEIGSKKIDEFYLDKMQKGQALTSKDYDEWLKWKTDYFNEMVANEKFPEDVKEYGDYYKELFIKPAVETFYKDKERLSLAYLSSLKSEKTIEFKREVEDKGETYNKNDFEFAVSQLERLGVDNAKEILSNQIATTFNSKWHSVMYNGINSETFKPYLEAIAKGKMSVDDAFRNMFNTIYSNQAYLNENGKYEKTNPNLSDAAFDRMIKSYQGWISAFNKKGESPTLGSLVPQLNKSVDVFNTSLQDAALAFDKATEEMNVLFTLCKSGNNKACSKYASLRDGQYTDLKLKVKQIDTFEKIYEEFDKNPSYLSNKEFSYSVATIDPLTGKEVEIEKQIDKNDVYNYISSKLDKSYSSAIESGDMVLANEVALKAKTLFKSGGVSTPIVSRLSNTIISLNDGQFAFSGDLNSPKKVLAYLTSAVTFNQSIDGVRYSGSSWINDKMLQRVTGYYDDLIQRRDSGEKGLDDKTIAQHLTAYINSERMRRGFVTLTDEQRKTVNAAIGDAAASTDDFVEWYVAGDGKFGVGTATVALKYVLNSDKVIANEDSMKEALQRNLKVMDDKTIPIFTNRTILFVPDAVIGLGADKYKETFFYALNKDIQKYNDFSNDIIHLRELTDDDVQVRQTIVNGQVYTFVDVFDKSGRRLHTAEITEDEWLKALNELEKQKIDNP